MLDLIILIFGCQSKPKYYDQLKIIEETWGKDLSENVKIKVFVGNEKPINNLNLEIITLNTPDDYYSATIKQYDGLRNILKNENFKFVFVCGGDTFVNIPKMLKLIETLNYQDKIYLGGHGDEREINNEKIYFHSGGGGFILSSSLVFDLFNNFPKIEEEWIKISGKYFKPSCDVSIAYFINKLENVKIIKNDKFYHCNYLGNPCHRNKIKKQEIITCHLMTPENVKKFYQELIENNFYL
jgi:hypothetical protein